MSESQIKKSRLHISTNLESVIQNEVRHRSINILLHMCGISKSSTDEPICRAGIEMQTENRWVNTVERKMFGVHLEIGTDVCALPCVKQIASANLL